MDECILHCVGNDPKKLTSEFINHNKWKAVLYCAQRLAKIDDDEQAIAQKILNVHKDSVNVDLDPGNVQQ